MKKLEAYNHFKKYLRERGIDFEESIDNGIMLIAFYQADIYENCPNGLVETNVWFYEDGLEARSFYDKLGSEICKSSEHISDLMRLFNYINSSIWPKLNDCANNEIYDPVRIYNPRIYITEDGCYDITYTTLINYEFYNLMPLETEDYIVRGCPSLMNMLSFPIFRVVAGNVSVDESIELIKSDVLR